MLITVSFSWRQLYRLKLISIQSLHTLYIILCVFCLSRYGANFIITVSVIISLCVIWRFFFIFYIYIDSSERVNLICTSSSAVITKLSESAILTFILTLYPMGTRSILYHRLSIIRKTQPYCTQPPVFLVLNLCLFCTQI